MLCPPDGRKWRLREGHGPACVRTASQGRLLTGHLGGLPGGGVSLRAWKHSEQGLHSRLGPQSPFIPHSHTQARGAGPACTWRETAQGDCTRQTMPPNPSQGPPQARFRVCMRVYVWEHASTHRVRPPPSYALTQIAHDAWVPAHSVFTAQLPAPPGGAVAVVTRGH